MKIKIVMVITIILISSFSFSENAEKGDPSIQFSPTISIRKDRSIVVSSVTAFDAPICQCAVNYQGKFAVKGQLSVKNGPVSLIMWSRVDGNYYFSKVPELQFVESSKNISFSIPFDSDKKTVDFIVLSLTMPKGGEASIKDISHKKQ